jgi:hypothetical protein
MYNSHIDEIIGQQRAPVRDTRNNTSALGVPVEVFHADRFHEEEVRGSSRAISDSSAWEGSRHRRRKLDELVMTIIGG